MVKGYRDHYTGEDKKDGNEEKQNQGRPRASPPRQPHKPFIYTDLRRINTSTTKEIRVKRDRFGIDCALGGGAAPYRTTSKRHGQARLGFSFSSACSFLPIVPNPPNPVLPRGTGNRAFGFDLQATEPGWSPPIFLQALDMGTKPNPG